MRQPAEENVDQLGVLLLVNLRGRLHRDSVRDSVDAIRYDVRSPLCQSARHWEIISRLV